MAAPLTCLARCSRAHSAWAYRSTNDNRPISADVRISGRVAGVLAPKLCID